MRFFCLISVLLLTTSIAVFSQTFRLEVDNEPLNRVLNRLDLEISFDDRALSAYSVSAARSFENPEKALMWLLEEKPFRVEKIGKVYVIVPRDDLLPKETSIAYRHTETERFVFKGTVVSQTTGESLELATVSLLDRDDRLFITGITNDRGRFSVQTPQIPEKIKISYLGYGTIVREINSLNGELGVFLLMEDVIQLDEAVVSADSRRVAINRSTYTVTPQVREGVDNALELLNKIPDAYFDKSSQTVLLNQHANILLLVDGIQHSHSYLNHLSPDRIHAVEVVYALSGRFVSDDYAGIIHFFLKKDYIGYDVHVSDAVSLNISKTAGYNRLSEHRPSLGFIYTTRKLNFFGMYGYDRENRNMNTSKDLTFSTPSLASLNLVSLPTEQPNNLYENEIHTVTGGVNYHLAPFQLLGIQADYTQGNTFTSTSQKYNMRRTDFAQNPNNDRIFTNTTENRIRAHTFTGSLFFQGQVSNRLHLHGDFSYNYYYNDMNNEYRQDDPYYPYTDLWDEYKHQTMLNVEGRYNLSSTLTVESGYANIRRQYASQSSQGKGFLDYGESRNKVFAYLTAYLSEKVGLKSGLALEHIGQHNGVREVAYLRTLPFLRIDYQISPSAHVATGYTTGQSYPALYQLSPIGIVIDTFLTQIGNPVLKSAVRHQVFAEITLWNRLKITPQFNYISDGVSESYVHRAFKLYRTFENVNFREYSLHASCDHAFGLFFRLKNTAMFYRGEALHQGIHSALNGWTLRTEADYYHSKKGFGLQSAYYRNMKRNILWQGYQMSDKDYWCLTARKELWDNRVSVMLSYIPPLALGIRYDRTKEMNTPLYQEKTSVNLKSYNQMLLLKVSLRLDRNSQKPTESRTDRRTDEREK